MRIEIEGAVVRLIPETERKSREINALWEPVAKCEREEEKTATP